MERQCTILSRRARPPSPDSHRTQQSWSEVGTVAVHHHCATYSLHTRRPRVLRRCVASLEQPPIAITHDCHLHGCLLNELEIFHVQFIKNCVLFLLCFMFLILLFCDLVMFCLIYGALIST